MTTYTPEQTRTWTADDWAKLNGRRIRLVLDGWTAERDRLVAHAVPGVGPVVTISFDPEGSWTFSPGEAEVTVLDDEAG